ncbi:class I SAM-dependent methyltransferase [bacterium (Candidatus Blackallbacteria) CG17_big_fil_post_rev_8_21_14_2_50_48_46]|uniref:Class I SAM-dependent methyltransferase n=1 Tax=bacterium (Candidatus Blackallbacteria) CG17_big_fil_post_rev_8_21_14_2_50_48_46 TaxID=2014261 RepID=A0A2M7G726_9BACT|nr:MAG: methyltransferase type 11 [bacterium (Candidatus Blackallbacteria) CG18_big_fil_WC_8_21_14_2_50_49_26]PIW17860.1 MAG: class I SAM-dependent methyltransferase [bacterium (Candidatus Blackallbacteria) CG17_big_fil_post_rev_8_21_14_2_50_48_46]PIW48536.1 MAG: class I SAM-dependent methyltransferase [bacterium (Candidatus Blackallbacteria) CG13_big_fil_rev_8_21_14_2_50_49_14]
MSQSENRQHWEAMAPRWKAWWGRYKPVSQPVSDHLVQRAELQTGQRVLDLATGMGEPALSFARALGPEGFVLGIDQSPQMIEWAQAEAEQAGLKNLRFEVQNAESLDLGEEAPFDALVSRWGLMFCSDPAGTLRNAARWLKPQGKLAAAVWCAPDEVPMIELASQVLERELGLVLHRPAPGPFSLADQNKLKEILAQAGFEQIQLEKVPIVLPCGSAQDYLLDRAQLLQPLAEALANMSPAERSHYDQALETAVEPWRQGDEVHLVNQALCICARKSK